MDSKYIPSFIWIKKYKYITNQGFHFITEYTYTFDTDKNILSRTKNKEYINDFFGRKINISAIVGENGSGKTTILSAIMACFTFLSKNIECIVAFDNGEIWQNGEKIIHYNFHNENSLELCEKNKKGEYSFPLNRPPITCVYYSQALDWSQFNNQNYAIINLSSGYLLPQNNSRDFFVREFNKQLRFINQEDEEIKNIINFNLPEAVQVKIIRYTLKEVASTVGISNNTCRKFFSVFYDYDIEKISNFSDYFKFDVSNSIICAIVKCFESGYASGIDRNILVECLKMANDGDVDSKDYWRNILRLIKCIKEKLNDDIYSKEREKITNIENLFIFIEEYMLNNINSNYKFERFSAPFSFTIPFDNKDIDENCPFVINFKDFWEKYEKVSVYFDIFDCSWNLSSGEISRLELYSRIFDIKISQNLGKFEYRDNIYRKDDSILLLIDEADMLLHPEWQRSLVNDITTVFPKIFPDQYISVILATHSPIMLSDIPKQNVLFLKKSDDGVVECDGCDTFASNIFQLFREGFFIGDTGIGVYAEEKLKEIVDHIHNNDIEDNKLKKLIASVGDTFLRNKLNEEYLMYRSQKNDTEKIQAERIAKLESVNTELLKQQRLDHEEKANHKKEAEKILKKLDDLNYNEDNTMEVTETKKKPMDDLADVIREFMQSFID